MAYQTGTATDVDDLIAKLSTFLQANGWTEDKYVAGSGDGWSSELYISKGASFFTIEAGVQTASQFYLGQTQTIDRPYIRIRGATGHDGGQPVSNQPNTHSNYAEVDWLQNNMTAYHFFTDPAQTYCHCVVESVANTFHHIVFGLANKIGTYDGGEYLFGHRHIHGPTNVDDPANSQHIFPWMGGGSSSTGRGYFHCNVDGVRWKRYHFLTTFQSIAASIQIGYTQGYPSEIWANPSSHAQRVATPQSFNDVSPLANIPCGWIIRSTTIWTPVGHFPDVRIVNMKNLSPGASLVLGGDTWRCFPLGRKEIPGLEGSFINTGYMGYAYKEIP